jgi:amino-acid N-acetyltransferase
MSHPRAKRSPQPLLARRILLRPAKEEEIAIIRQLADEYLLDNEDLQAEQFTVAELDGKLVGFGRIKPYRDADELSTLAVLKPYRNQGIGRRIVEHLIARFPRDDIYLTTDIPDYFEKLGFRRASEGPPEIQEKIRRVCARFRGCAVIMVRRKPEG